MNGGRKQANERPKMSEEEFLGQVLELAKLFGWGVAHFRPAKTSKGWRTAVQGDGKGFPDLVLVQKRVIFAELKSEGGKMSSEQVEWSDWLQDANAEWYCWRPSDWEEIKILLGE